VGRFEQWPVVTSPIPGVGPPVNNAFPDQFNKEYSRDIEPMVGGYGDNYYYQMICNIRKFKGMPQQQRVSDEKTIIIDGYFDDWNDVLPDFNASKGNIFDRDGYGYIDPESQTGNYLRYFNHTGRNDIVRSKVARNENFIFFYVETVNDLSSHADENWMRLFIDIDRCNTTGWEGYDIALNIESPSENYSILSETTEGWNWETADDHILYEKFGNAMEISIPRSYFAEQIDFEFKWSDNMQVEGDISDFLINGDVAPSGRFNYSYSDLTDLVMHHSDHSKGYITVSPNPVTDQTQIIIDAGESGIRPANGLLTIHNMPGQLLYCQPLDFTKAVVRINYDASSIQPGMYTVSVYSDAINFETTKFFKIQ
jgi:hypothetical protein